MSYGATLAWLLFGITLRHHAAPVRHGPALGLLRRRALSRWPVTIAQPGRRARRGSAAEPEPRPASGRRPRARGDREPVVPADVHRGRARGGVPVAAAPLGRRSRSRARDQITAARVAALAGRPGHVHLQGPGRYRSYQVPIDGATSTSWRSSSRAARAARSSTRPTRCGRRSPGRARGGRSTTSGRFAPHWENFAKVWDLLDYPRLLFNTDRHRASSGWSGRSSRARSWPTASPASGSPAGTCCSCCSSRRSSCPPR